MTCDHARALALAKAGQWDAAHELVQPYSDRNSCLIHAYLHRVEGDHGNARYWYRQAGETMPANTLEEELERLADAIAGQA
ncbi:hypothetical protein [Nodosilinea nodulosa]|uniref:hypothetical protein n=1 Tax=Nodosilinea nodulosa TaxID=416001 RepID=UPI0002FD6764|nr:hypothetical protein [Nodosilinea nodulosa]